MNEPQSIGGYYSFPSTTVDRYRSTAAAVMTVAARRLDLSAPAERGAQLGEHALRLHARLRRRRPCTAARPTPTATRASRSASSAPGDPLGLTQPRVYFGERAPRRPAVRGPQQRAAARSSSPSPAIASARATTTTATAGSRSPTRSGAPRSRLRFDDLELAADRDRHGRLADRSCTATRASGCARSRRSWTGTPSRRPSSPAAACSSCSTATRPATPTRTRRPCRRRAVNYLRAPALARRRRVRRARDALRRRRRRSDPARLARRLPGPVRAVGAACRAALRAHLRYPRAAVRGAGRGLRDLPRRRRDRLLERRGRLAAGARSWPGRSSRPARSTSPTRAARRDARSTPPPYLLARLPGRRATSASCSPRRSRRAGARTSSPTSPARSTRAAGRGSRC